jgi:hypothetical protein
LLFFEKDPITSWSDTLRYAWYRKMNHLKHTYPALQNGDWGAKEEVLKVTGGNENVYAFKRSKNGQTVTVIVNLDNKQHWIPPATPANTKVKILCLSNNCFMCMRESKFVPNFNAEPTYFVYFVLQSVYLFR